MRDGYAFSGAVPRTLALLATRFGASSRGLLLYGYSAGGSLVWRTMEGGHGLGASADRIDPEYRSPLYTPAFAELWRRVR